MLTLLNELGHTKKANKIIHLLFLIMLEKKNQSFSFSVETHILKLILN